MENTLKEHSNIDEDAPGNIIKEDAEELFYEIDSNTTIKFNLPKNIKEYLQDLLSGNIKNALFKIEKPLSDTSQLLSWIREFFFGKTISGIAFGEIMNEAHNDRAYNINHTQKPSNSGCVSKNDAILYQDEIPAVLYEQSFEPTEFMLKHQLEDFAKLTNYFIFLKYLVSVYLTDIICIGTYRIYEVFSCKIPISYSEQWQLVNIAKLGALLEELLIEQQNIKEEMSKESILNDSNTDCVYNWIKIPNNTPKSKTINK
ncbi:8294_t:CDS:2 [Entrophospora sp. SA101]|nr:8294_t:CDS:2 [Entrophospora sp. SA101]